MAPRFCSTITNWRDWTRPSSSPSSTTLWKTVTPPVPPSSHSQTVNFKHSIQLTMFESLLFCLFFVIRSHQLQHEHTFIIERLLRQRRLAHQQQQPCFFRAERNVCGWQEHLCSKQDLLFTNATNHHYHHHHQTSFQEEAVSGNSGPFLGAVGPQLYFQ